MTKSLRPELVPKNDLQREGDWWKSTGDDPYFFLDFGQAGFPSGWNIIKFEAEGEGLALAPVLYIDDGAGFSQDSTRHITTWNGRSDGSLIRLPAGLRTLRLDPLSGLGRFRVKSLSIQPVSRYRVAYRRLRPVLQRLRKNPSFIGRYAVEAVRVLKLSGLKGLLRHALRERHGDQANDPYQDWIAQFDTLREADLAAIALHIRAFKSSPLISVLVPLYNTPAWMLRQCVESVRKQAYPNWELCLVDDGSSDPEVAKLGARYAGQDKRIKFQRRPVSGHIAAATNTALDMATGEYVALLDHDDELAVHALYMMAAEIDANPALDMLFSDEDKIDENGRRFEPWFKPDWNYDLMLSQNAVVHLAAYRRSLLQEVGGFRTGFDGSQDYDVTLRFSERTTPDRIRHIPHILYHWRAISGSVALAATEKIYPYEAAARAIQEHLSRAGHDARVEMQPHLGYYRVHWPLPAQLPRVAIIIPTKDKVELLRVAVQTILEKTSYAAFEIVVVNNRSVQAETFEYLAEIAKDPRVRVLDYDRPYSFAALNNWAVTQTDAELLAFVNNDIEVITAEWLTDMASQALRPDVGAVGAKLFYPNETIQHAGVVVGIGGLAGHPHVGLSRHGLGYFGRAACTQRFSAVTAACMVMRRAVFDEVHGFDEEHFAIAFNDVDIGLRLGRAGYAVVWTPHAQLFHYESASLGLPSGEERRAQFLEECANFKRIWADVIANDPFYNPNLTITGGDFSPAVPPRAAKPWLRFAPPLRPAGSSTSSSSSS
ncbi:glycosyltransferase family 2 protein [Variovorax sp. KK3]|uniref:glycosyltransferase family 2 protein n=1 Tax=Variovorax sp. KK3 TaxID=1855728 RepID=UPI00097BFF0F|nr:glycosyltransferase family 2 protein [Variovorax sp. KK3]